MVWSGLLAGPVRSEEASIFGYPLQNMVFYTTENQSPARLELVGVGWNGGDGESIGLDRKM